MSSFKHLLQDSAFIIIALSLFLMYAKGSYIPTGVSRAPSHTNSEPSSFYEEDRMSTARSEDAKQDSENSTVEEKLKEFFDPFLAFPFFPFHFPNLKRDIFQVNATEKAIPIEKGDKLSGGGRKPFLFFDFAFNIREVPQKNQTDEPRSTALGRSSPKKIIEKSEAKKQVPFDVIDDDWSFFDDSPLFAPDMDEFLPKSDFLFFDFPFHRKHSKKFVRNKRDMTKPAVKRDLNLFVDIFDDDRKEVERSGPLWIQMSESGQGESSVDKGVLGEDAVVKEGGKFEKRARGMKRSPHEPARRKNPVILGKVVKFGEIHFGDDYPKTKKKRRSTSASGKKGSRGFEEASIEMVEMNEPLRSNNLELSPLHASLKDVFHRLHQDHQQSMHEKEHKELHSAKLSHKSEDAKILDLMTQWDRREMEQMGRATTQKSGTAQSHANILKERDPGRSNAGPWEEGFKYIGHEPNERHQARGSAGFEVLKPQAPFARHKRQESVEDNATSSSDEVRKNITHVLGQFFSMIRKLGDSKSFYREDSENPEIEDVNWPELSDAQGSGSHIKMKRPRRARDAEDGEEEKPRPVADLNHLFLTVTLPTMFAFTLLLAVCFFNLRVRGWLCTKLFKPRHVYVVERDVEKTGKAPAIVKEEMLEEKLHRENKHSEGDKRKRREKPENVNESKP